MNKFIFHPAWLKAGLAMAVVSSLVFTGCVGYVGPGYGDGDGVVVGGPDVFWGGVYDRGPVVRGYSQRGFASRGFAHGGGGHGGGGHGGGGHR